MLEPAPGEGADAPPEQAPVAVASYELGAAAAEHPAVTFLHGFPSSSLDIAAVADELGADVRMLTIDFPGFGASAKPADHVYSIHACADAIERLWDAHALESTVIVAHDYGVSVAQELLARRGDGQLATTVLATVWMNGGLYPDLHRPTVGQQLLLDPEHGAELAATVDRSSFTNGIAVTWGERIPMDDDEIGEMYASMAEAGGTARMHDLLHYIADRRRHEARWRTAHESTNVPAHFVWGDLDPVSGAHMIARVEQRLPRASITRLADVGHWPLLEAPATVATIIRAALNP
jgi:pimeloyl-ACP methyl ester carboxylesterase